MIGRIVGNVLAIVLIIGPCVLAMFVQHLCTQQLYPAEAAEAPTLSCGCADRGVQYTCMHCDNTRCGFHRDFKHTCPRQDEERPIAPIPGTPAIVAGDDLVWADRRDRVKVAEQFAAMASEMAELDACDGLAEFYLRPEVSQ